MADDEALEFNEDSKKDREEAEQSKALNAVTDNVSSSCSSRRNCNSMLQEGELVTFRDLTVERRNRRAHPLWFSSAGAREAAR